MGNKQTALSGIHPFKDENDPSGLPAPPLIQFPTFPSALEELTQQESHQPQQVTIGPASPRWIEATQGNKFDELFVMKAPTPPPRRPSEPLRGTLKGKQGMKGGFSLRNLPKMIGRPDLNKLGTLLRWRKKRKSGDVYPVPPDAEKPSPPSRPEVFLEQDEFFLLRWDPPAYDGGLPIIGYIIQHLELGLPQIDSVEKDETQSWYSSEPGQVTSTEVLLNNLIEGTTYQFRVIAENLLGYSQPGELSEPIVFNPRGILNDYFCPPVLIISLDETYNAIEHERLVLSLEITGQPYPIVKWYDKNEVEIGGVGSDPRYIVTSRGQKRILTIAGVECSDSGGIRAVGENEKGFVECKTTLVVEAPPHIRRVQRLDLMKSEDPQELPSDDQKLLKRRDSRNDEEIIFQSGELGRFKFLWSASPYPNICVYHEGDLVDGEETGGDRGLVRSDRVVTEVSDNLITVKINGIQRTDRGEWTVRLDNVLGEDSAIVIVTVTDRPSRTGKPDVLQLSDNTVILKWDKPQDDGGCPVQGYIVEYFRSEWGVWLKACTTKNPYTKIRDLIPGSKYKFRIKAENLYGVSEPSEESIELLITDLASTLRSVSGDGEGAAMLMTTVEEEEEEAVQIEEEEPGTGRPSKPTPSPRRRFDRGSSASLMRVSTSTMTDLSGLIKGKSGTVESVEPASASIPRPASSPVLLQPQTQSIRRSPSPSTAAKFLSVSFQPQVIVLPDDDEGEDVLQPPEIVPRRLSPEVTRRSPSPRNINITFERSPSPLPPKSLSRTVVQQLNYEEPEPPMRIGAIRKSPSRSPVVEDMRAPAPTAPPRHQQHHPPPSPRPQPPQVPVQIQPITDAPKKLYSRAEIIKSAAANELDYYYLGLTESSGGEAGAEEHHEEEPEEDPELLKVKEALKNDTLFDDLEDDEEEEEDYEYDFDKLREEYEEDKKKGMVSRQDSGVSGKSVEKSESIEEPSYSEDLEEDEKGAERAASVQSERVGMRTTFGSHREPFERAQSEVVGARRADSDFIDRRREYRPPGGPPSASGSRTFLTDRFTDYIAMKASSRNKAVGSSLRSLSRYSSTENVEGKGSVSRDSGRSSMVVPESIGGGGVGGGGTSSGEEKLRPEEREGEDNNTVINRVSLLERPFTFREFRAEEEMKGVKVLEGSKPGWGSKRSVSSLPYDLVHPVQTGDGSRRVLGAGNDATEGKDLEELEREEEEERKKRTKAPPVPVVPNRFISNPDIFLMMSGDGGRRGREVLEHSKSETNFDTWIPDSVLKMRAGSFINRGGCGGEDTTEEDYSEAGGSADIGFERDCPADRKEAEGERERRTVSFGVDTDEEFSYEEEYEKIEEDDGAEDHGEEGALEEIPRLEEILEEGGNEPFEEGEEEEVFEMEVGSDEEIFEQDEEDGEEVFEQEERDGEEEEVFEQEEGDEELDEEIERMKSQMLQLELELGLAERDFGDMPQENVWVEEHVLEEYSEEEDPKKEDGEKLEFAEESNLDELRDNLKEKDEGEEKHAEDVIESMPIDAGMEEKLEVIKDSEPDAFKTLEESVQDETPEQPLEKPEVSVEEKFVEKPVLESDQEIPEEFKAKSSKEALVELEEAVLEESFKMIAEDHEAGLDVIEIPENDIVGELEKDGIEQQVLEVTSSITDQEEQDPNKREPTGNIIENVEDITENLGETIPEEGIIKNLEASESFPEEEIVEKETDESIPKEEIVEEEGGESVPGEEIVEEDQEISMREETIGEILGAGESIIDENVNIEDIKASLHTENEDYRSIAEEERLNTTKFVEGIEVDQVLDLLENFGESIKSEEQLGHSEIQLEEKIATELESVIEPQSEILQTVENTSEDDNTVEGHFETTQVLLKTEEASKTLTLPPIDTFDLPENEDKIEANIKEKDEEYLEVPPEDEMKVATKTLPDSTQREPILRAQEVCDVLVVQKQICDIPEPDLDKTDSGALEPTVEADVKTVEEIPTLAEIDTQIEPKDATILIDSPLEEPQQQIEYVETVRLKETSKDNSKPVEDIGKTIKTSVQLEDTLIIEDVVIGKVNLEMDLERIHQVSVRLRPQISDQRLASTSPKSPSPVEEEIDKELLSIHMNLSNDHPHPHHHTHHHHGESRRTISIDRLISLTPVEEESSAEFKTFMPPAIPHRRPPPQSSASSSSSYRPNMSIYDKIMAKSSSPSSLSSSRASILSRSSSITITSPRASSPYHVDENSSLPLDISEIRHTILQSSPREFLESFSKSSQASSPRGTPPPSSSRPSTPVDASSSHQLTRTERDYPDEISPFMNYLFHGAFYLMLSPMLLFVDSLYLALVCLVVVACVHFFIMKF